MVDAEAFEDGGGDAVPALQRLLAEHPGLATARLGDYDGRAATVAALVAAGADAHARFTGPHNETPLHWAASCDDVDVWLRERGAKTATESVR